MFKKSLIAAALVVPALALSSAAFSQAYQGGPRGGLATRTQTVDSKPYAQFVTDSRAALNKYGYQGGPETAAPHGR